MTQICAKTPFGAPWGLESPDGFSEPTMVCGLDVYHGGVGKKSVMAFTCSLDINVSKHWSQTVSQESHEELSSQLRDCVQGGIKAFSRLNSGVSPKKVIIYRDGVSEGQMQAVLEGEVREVLNALGGDVKLV